MIIPQETKVDLDPKDLDLIRTILQRHLELIPPAIVSVFGSRATNRAKKYSDLDLIIDLSGKSVPEQTMVALAYDFEESLLPFKVDIIDWAKISGPFREQINAEKKIIWFHTQ